MKYQKEAVDLSFTAGISYLADGEEKYLEFSGMEKEQIQQDGILWGRWYETVEGDSTVFRMEARNIGKRPIRLKAFHLMKIRAWEEFRLGSGQWERYQVLCEGRHKNDIPSVCTLGQVDENWKDAGGGLSESGDVLLSGNNMVLLSDSLTVFAEGKDRLMMAFPKADRYFVSCRITPYQEQEKILLLTEPNILLLPGKQTESGALELMEGEDEIRLIEHFAEQNAQLKKTGLKRKKTPVVYCTWYYYGLTVSYQDVRENLDAIVRRQIPYDVFQIDEGWEVTLGEWKPNQKFGKPMKQIADEIREAGMTPGLWSSPFIAHETASVWELHPDWKLRNYEGVPYEFPMNDTVYQVLDISRPDVVAYIESIYRMFTEEWGYTYHKLDFTRAAVIYPDADFYDQETGLPELYARAMEAVRRGIGEDSYLLVCGGLYDPLIGIADAQRTGSDVLAMWASNINKDGKTVPYTVKQNILRFYMSRWWDNDPDALMLRRQEEMFRGLRLSYGLLTDEEVRTVLLNQYLASGLISQTEALDRIDEDRLWQLKHLLPKLEHTVQALHLFDSGRFPEQVLLKGNDYYEVVRINWQEEEELSGDLLLSEEQTGIVLTQDERYLVSEFFSGMYQVAKPGETICFPAVRPHGSALYKIRRYDPEKPYIAAGNAHFSLGEELTRLEIQKNRLYVQAEYLFPAESFYTVLLPERLQTEDGKQEIQLQMDRKQTYSWEFELKERKQEYNDAE